MSDLIGKVRQVGVPGARDTQQPAKLELLQIRHGDFQQQNTQNRVDPLLIQVGNYESGCRLQVLVKSGNPSAKWEKDGKFLPESLLQHIEGNRYGVMLGNNEAAAVGIKPGHVFYLRQVDASGNAGDHIEIKLNTKTGNEWLHGQNLWATDAFGAPKLGNAQYLYAPYADQTPPAVFPEGMQIAVAGAPGEAVFTGKEAIDPHCTITVENERTKEKGTGTSDADGNFNVAFKAQIGDPIHVWATDHNGVTQELGMTKFNPGLSYLARPRREMLEKLVHFFDAMDLLGATKSGHAEWKDGIVGPYEFQAVLNDPGVDENMRGAFKAFTEDRELYDLICGGRPFDKTTLVTFLQNSTAADEKDEKGVGKSA